MIELIICKCVITVDCSLFSVDPIHCTLYSVYGQQEMRVPISTSHVQQHAITAKNKCFPQVYVGYDLSHMEIAVKKTKKSDTTIN